MSLNITFNNNSIKTVLSLIAPKWCRCAQQVTLGNFSQQNPLSIRNRQYEAFHCSHLFVQKNEQETTTTIKEQYKI